MTRKEIEKLYDDLLRAEEKSLTQGTEQSVREYNNKKEKLHRDAEEEGRRLYTAYTRSVTDLPAQLARMGITGGAAETRALRLRTGYVNDTNALAQSTREQSAALDSAVEEVRRKAETARTEARARNAAERLNAILKVESDEQRLAAEQAARAKAEKALAEAQAKQLEAEKKKSEADTKKYESEEHIKATVAEAVKNARAEWMAEQLKDESAVHDKQLLAMLDVVRPYAHLMDKKDTEATLARKLMLEVGPVRANGYARALLAARKRGIL